MGAISSTYSQFNWPKCSVYKPQALFCSIRLTPLSLCTISPRQYIFLGYAPFSSSAHLIANSTPKAIAEFYQLSLHSLIHF